MATSRLLKAKIFKHGRSQAIRLPKEFRFQGTEVYLRRVGDDLVISSKPKPSMQTLIDSLNQFEPGLVLERNQPTQLEQRADLPMPAKRPPAKSRRTL